MGMNDLLKRLHEGLGPELARHHFRFNPASEAYLREQPGGVSQFFYVRCYESGSSFVVEPGVGIRIDRIEDVFHRTSGFEQKYQPTTPTVGAEVWRLEGNPKAFRYRLGGSDDVGAVTEEVGRAFEGKALPYFASHSSVEAVDRLLNETPLEKTPHRMMEWLRASTGVIAARIVCRENFDELVAVYRTKLERLDRGFYLPQFEALLRNLAEHGV